MHAGDGRHVRIPYEQVDHEASTPQRIVVDLPGDALLASAVQDASVRDAGDRIEHDASASLTIPLATEELVAGTREVEQGRVLVRKRVDTVPQDIQVEVGHDEVDVERIPVGREIAEAPAVRHEGDTMIIPVIEEVLVVEKRLRLVEEVRITTRRVSEQRTIREEVRREAVEVDTAPADGPPDH
jgi:uncharacterized protein (TIGR02271 family)